MKRAILALAVLACLTAVFVVNLGALDVPDHPWTNFVVEVGVPGWGLIGSGFILTSDGYIMTAAHVAEDEEYIAITLKTQKSNKISEISRLARVVFVDYISDYAILKVELANFEVEAAKIGQISNCKIGDDIYLMGHPYAFEWMLFKGILSAIKYTTNGYVYLFSDVNAGPGNSGCPIMNKDGEVLGLLQMGARGVFCFGIGIPQFNKILTAIIQADRDLETTRHELEQKKKNRKAEWKRIMKKIEEEKE